MGNVVDPRLSKITERICNRSLQNRRVYLAALASTRAHSPPRRKLSCGNIAHAAAACGAFEKQRIASGMAVNLGIVTSYNDMLSAHQPFHDYPTIIKDEAHKLGITAQVAGGTPAMCDGITQGQSSMDLSLFSRDVIALSTAIALSHNTFDAALLLGICDKIVPGLLIGALSFGHLPMVFVPAGPMPSGLSNELKNKVRRDYAAGEVDKSVLLRAELESYHAPGTCTFYGTANSNQMLMEIMGLHVPGAAFENPGTALRNALTRHAVHLAAVRAKDVADGIPVGIGEMLDEKSFVNGIIGLHATGGSTNHIIHLIAAARAAGIVITLDDFSDLAKIIPLLARVYPNGRADVNQFHAAGGVAFVIRELSGCGLLHDDVPTVAGRGLARYALHAVLGNDAIVWTDLPQKSPDDTILRPATEPFQATGGLAVVSGNLGRAIVKVSAVDASRHVIEAPARIFANQQAVSVAFKAGELDRDVVVVLRFQGPRANGMPELHGLMPILGVLQGRGHRVALVSDGRLSGASGAVLSAIHVTPEAETGGAIARLLDGDIIRIDANAGTLDARVPVWEWDARICSTQVSQDSLDMGRNLFAVFRDAVGAADVGASIFHSGLPVERHL